MASVFGVLQVVDMKIENNHIEWIGYEEGTEETPHPLGITSSLLNVSKILPFRLYYEYFYRTGEFYVCELPNNK